MDAVQRTARLVKAVQNAWTRKGAFFVLFVVVLFLSFSGLMWFGLVPDGSDAPRAPAATAGDQPLVALTTVSQSSDAAAAFATGELPVKIEVPSIGLSATIANPTTTNIETLDHDLLSGAVRYPTSALLGENGNVILFGHSSYLPIVNNLAYKTFDGIQKLEVGDTITVYSSDRVYTYAVDSVQKADANSAAIPLAVDGQHLTLSTCDSFATKSDRFIVSAMLVGSHSLGN